jgi:pyruvate-formate lyase-activating enzyme
MKPSLSFSRQDIETLTRPLCTQEQFKRKWRNYEAVERSFKKRDEVCAGLPIELNLEPSGNCNLHCRGCPRGRGRIKRSGNLPYPVLETVLAQLGPTLCNVFISGFGEPLCNPDTPRMIALSTEHSASTVMNTNGTLLTQYVDVLLDAQLTLINVALDGAVANSYHQYASQEQFDAVVCGVERLRQRKEHLGSRYPMIEGQFLIGEDSLNEMGRLEQWAKGIGIERVKFKRPYLSMPGDEERPAVESVSDYLRLLGLDVKSTEKTHWTPADCTLPWENMLLSCNGQIGICCYDPHLRLQLDEPGRPLDMFELWNGTKIQQVRRWLAEQETKAIQPCSRCNRMPGYLWPA